MARVVAKKKKKKFEVVIVFEKLIYINQVS